MRVIVVGAGPIGSSVAWHLAQRGADVRVLERESTPAQGSVSKATGGFRLQYGSAINAQLSQLSLQKLLRFKEDTGVDPHYNPAGYLFLAQSQAQLQELHRTLALQHQALGQDVAQEVDPEEILQRNPALDAHALENAGVIGGTFGLYDGFTRPLELTRGYREAAERLGVVFHYKQHATVYLQHGRVAGVRSNGETLQADAVVNAAGAWANSVLDGTGVSVPVVPERRQVAITQAFAPTATLHNNLPLTVWLEDGFHWRIRDNRALVLLPSNTTTPDPYDTRFDPTWLDGVVARIQKRVPQLAKLPLDQDNCWCGLYETSPDHHALLGELPELPGLYLANGSSGHGVMHSAAIGQLLSEAIMDGQAHTLNIHTLRPTRFSENDPVLGSGLL